MTVDVLPAHPHLWAVAVQVVCFAAIVAAAAHAWRQGMGWWLGRALQSLRSDPDGKDAVKGLVALLARQVVREHMHRVTGALIEDQHRAALAELHEELAAWPSPVEALR